MKYVYNNFGCPSNVLWVIKSRMGGAHSMHGDEKCIQLERLGVRVLTGSKWCSGKIVLSSTRTLLYAFKIWTGRVLRRTPSVTYRTQVGPTTRPVSCFPSRRTRTYTTFMITELKIIKKKRKKKITSIFFQILQLILWALADPYFHNVQFTK